MANLPATRRGFSAMDKNKQREIASKGGKAAHQKGTAHEFTTQEAREAGRKGGATSRARRTPADQQSTPPSAAPTARDQESLEESAMPAEQNNQASAA